MVVHKPESWKGFFIYFHQLFGQDEKKKYYYFDNLVINCIQYVKVCSRESAAGLWLII